MSGLERHGIKHLSASSLNLWSAMPGLWALKYLCGFKDFMGPAAARGTAVEVALMHILHKRDDPLQAAYDSFDQNVQGEIGEKVTEERERLVGMVSQCSKWKPPGELMASQIKIECWLDGISVPVIGYVDMSFEDVDVDLKTIKACPSKPKPDHVRQIAIYRAARNKQGRLLYLTDKKQAEFEVTDEMRDEAMAELRLNAESLDRFLGAFNDPRDAMRCLPIDRDNFRWSALAEREYRTALEGGVNAADLRMLADIGFAFGFEATEI